MSSLGGSCNYSKDCLEGYCTNLTCQIPSILVNYKVTGNCTSSMNCGSGFCKDNQCILPTANNASVLAQGINLFAPATGANAACEGFINNCTGIWCLFCDATWPLLIIAAAAAAFVSMKRGRILPVLMFLLPVLFGILIFSMAGLILAIIEIFMIAFLKLPVKTMLESMKPITEITTPPKPLMTPPVAPQQPETPQSSRAPSTEKPPTAGSM